MNSQLHPSLAELHLADLSRESSGHRRPSTVRSWRRRRTTGREAAIVRLPSPSVGRDPTGRDRSAA
ncbi:MAG: hypothetical protein ABW122_10835 [Ilumatobacteraceae bacterium]